MKKAILAAAVVGLSAAAVNAGVLTITDTVGGMTSLNQAGGTITTTGINPQSTAAASYRVDLFMQVGSLTGTEVGFGNVNLDFTYSGAAARDTAAGRTGWVGNNPIVQIDTDGDGVPDTNVTQFNDNKDAGTSTTDLKSVLINLGSGLDANAGFAPVIKVGQAASTGAANPGPFKIGSVWVSFPGGNQTGTLSVSLTPGSTTWSTSNGNPTVLTNQTNAVGLPADITFGSAGPATLLSLTQGTPAATPTVGTVTVTGSNGNYKGGITSVTGQSGNVQISGLGAEAGQIPVLFEFTAASTVGDVNSFATFASSQTGVLSAAAGTIPGWAAGFNNDPADHDVLVTFSKSANASPFFVNFSGLNTIGTGSLVLDQVAAVPEPTIIGLLGFVGMAALSRRRRAA